MKPNSSPISFVTTYTKVTLLKAYSEMWYFNADSTDSVTPVTGHRGPQRATERLTAPSPIHPQPRAAPALCHPAAEPGRRRPEAGCRTGPLPHSPAIAAPAEVRSRPAPPRPGPAERLWQRGRRRCLGAWVVLRPLFPVRLFSRSAGSHDRPRFLTRWALPRLRAASVLGGLPPRWSGRQRWWGRESFSASFPCLRRGTRTGAWMELRSQRGRLRWARAAAPSGRWARGGWGGPGRGGRFLRSFAGLRGARGTARRGARRRKFAPRVSCAPVCAGSSLDRPFRSPCHLALFLVCCFFPLCFLKKRQKMRRFVGISEPCVR